jgi:hypothetical protein
VAELNLTKEDSMSDRRWAGRLVAAAGVTVLGALFAGASFAQGPPVSVKTDKFETARQKNAMKALRMKAGYKGDVEARALADKLLKAARYSDSVALKDDKANHMIHVSRLDPSGHFRIDKTTGDFSFSKGMKEYLNDRESMGLPAKDRAPDIAKKHLTDLGLMPEKLDELVLLHVGGLKQVDVTPDGKSVERDKLVTVNFGRKIDGIPVGGPGSKIVVDLGANGELVSISKRWIEVTEEKKNDSDFKAQLDVVNNIKDRLKNDGEKARSIDASNPDFGYFDDGKGNIEPAYFYTADLTYDLEDEGQGRKEHKEKHHGAVPALKSSKADFEQLEKAKMPPGKANPVEKDKPSVKD